MQRAQSTQLHLVRLDVTPHRLGERRDGISDRLRAELAATSRLKVDQARLNLFLADDGEDRHLRTMNIALYVAPMATVVVRRCVCVKEGGVHGGRLTFSALATLICLPIDRPPWSISARRPSASAALSTCAPIAPMDRAAHRAARRFGYTPTALHPARSHACHVAYRAPARRRA